MSNLIATSKCQLIVGGGATGLSIARYFAKNKLRFHVYDTRLASMDYRAFQHIDETVFCYSTEPSSEDLAQYEGVVVSPGVDLKTPIIVDAKSLGLSVVGDIALFLKAVTAPVIGITGSNGKSTVTTLVGKCAEAANIKVAVGGNLGLPALDLLNDSVELYVLELSSFQLESTDTLNLFVAANLNVSPDHMDRHGSMPEYFRVKQKIFHGAKNVVYKLSDMLTQPPVVEKVERFGFDLNKKMEVNETQYYFDKSTRQLMRGAKALFSADQIAAPGSHNIENILAVAAICEAAGIPLELVLAQASQFLGLPHRCERIANISGVEYINDSKATNTGACIAAIEGMRESYNSIVLIAGGVGKGADFSALAKVILCGVRHVVLIGEDASLLSAAIEKAKSFNTSADVLESIHFEHAMDGAVKQAFTLASGGDVVLLSPACASFDMFKNFEDRGLVFGKSVRGLAS